MIEIKIQFEGNTLDMDIIARKADSMDFYIIASNLITHFSEALNITEEEFIYKTQGVIELLSTDKEK